MCVYIVYVCIYLYFIYHNNNGSIIDNVSCNFSAFLLQTFHYINITKSILSRYMIVKLLSTCEIFKNYAQCSSSRREEHIFYANLLVSLFLMSLSLLTWSLSDVQSSQALGHFDKIKAITDRGIKR